MVERRPRSVLVAVSFILLSHGSPVSSSEPPDELTTAPSLALSVNLIRSCGSRSGAAQPFGCQKTFGGTGKCVLRPIGRLGFSGFCRLGGAYAEMLLLTKAISAVQTKKSVNSTKNSSKVTHFFTPGMLSSLGFQRFCCFCMETRGNLVVQWVDQRGMKRPGSLQQSLFHR